MLSQQKTDPHSSQTGGSSEEEHSLRTQSTSISDVTAVEQRRRSLESGSPGTPLVPLDKSGGRLISPPAGTSIAENRLSATTFNRTTSISRPSSISSITESGDASSMTTSSANYGDEGRWGNKHEKLLSLFGLIVSFGNIWRFPYLCLVDGGGTFLVLYLLFHMVLGLPVIYLEMVLGQYSSAGPIGVFTNLVPLLQGLGWAVISANILQSIYYNVVMAWAVFFLANSFNTTLPWTTCTKFWNTDLCYSSQDNKNCKDNYGDSFYWYQGDCRNSSALREDQERQRSSADLHLSSHELFDYRMYNLSHTSPGIGYPQWHLSLCLLFCWIITLVCVIRSVRSFGLIVYFTTPLPLVMLLALSIFGATRKGAAKGIEFFFHVDCDRFWDPRVWVDAGTQVLHTTAPAVGTLITLGSYNQFKNNCFRDTVLMLLVNAGASLLCGFSVFSILGFLASPDQWNITDIMTFREMGEDLAFVAYAEVVSQAGVFGPAFSVIFFLTVITLGLDTQFIQVETVVVAICEQWPNLKPCRWLIVCVQCLCLFLLGLPMCTEGGLDVFIIFDKYSSSLSLLYLALFELISAVYIYGWRRVGYNIRYMIGSPRKFLPKWFGPTGHVTLWLWFGLCGPLLLVLALLQFLDLHDHGLISRNTADDDRSKSHKEMKILGWCMVFVPLVIICVFGSVRLVSQLLECRPLRQLLVPTDQWCPAHMRPVKSAPLKRTKRHMSAALDMGTEEVIIKRF